ncbi:MAG: non-canonical purine NTP diphosphatase [Bacteroidaceae bacterium]|nr:non-canonical purine NTP diphosphatase [Bacteroidaceae bacterium]
MNEKTTKRKLVFATNNAHKLSEICAIIGDKFEILSLNDIECFADIPETADTLEGNALQKAEYVYNNYGLDCFADDTGLEVETLGGRPGVHTARYAFPDRYDPEANTEKLLQELDGKENRRARFRTAIAYIRGGEKYLFEGVVEGEISTEKRGDKGFGYDPVFIPENTGKTFAELGVEVKNQISHRARAVAKLCEYLAAEEK